MVSAAAAQQQPQAPTTAPAQGGRGQGPAVAPGSQTFNTVITKLKAGKQVFHNDPESRDAYLAMVRRQLFVGMTRARDGLWLGWAGHPSPLLPKAIVDQAHEPALA